MAQPTGNAFDRLRQEAKFLLKDVRRGDEAAIQRFTQYWPVAGPSGEVRNLARAQLVIARERGYRSWVHLKTSLLAEKEQVMKVKEVADQVVKIRRQGSRVHVYVGREQDVQTVLEALAERGVRDVGRVGPLPSSALIPDSEVVVGIWPEYAFAYARRVHKPAEASSEERRVAVDALLGGAIVVVMGIPIEERRTPCTISDKEKTLASVGFDELTGKYRTVIEI